MTSPDALRGCRTSQPRASAIALAATALAAGVLVLSAPAARAFVPSANRVAGAIAKGNAASGRAQTLRLELTMRIADGPPVARGELVTHPTGMARLELRGAGALVERHVLVGTEHLGGRDGRILSEPREFLPPLFLLQSDSVVSLRAALDAFGFAADFVGLAPCGESDCYVIGDPARVAPLPGPQPEPSEDAGADGTPWRKASPQPVAPPEETQSEGSGGFGARLFARSKPPPPPTLWVDVESFDVRRMRFPGGVRVRFGPYSAFEGIRVPSWLVIEEGRGTVRFDVEAVTPVSAPASAFGRDWILELDPGPPADFGGLDESDPSDPETSP